MPSDERPAPKSESTVTELPRGNPEPRLTVPFMVLHIKEPAETTKPPRELYVRPAMISTMMRHTPTHGEPYTRIWTAGDPSEYEVVETPEEILELLELPWPS